MAKWAAAAATFFAGIAGSFTAMWKAHGRRIGALEEAIQSKADREDVNKELHLVRQNLGRVFEQIRENEQRASDRHERILEALRK